MKLESYQHYLESEFENRKIRNPSYSLRAFARDLQTSPSRLSEALNGKRGISIDLARRMIRNLKLEGVDSEIFILSVEAQHSRSSKQKSIAQKKLEDTLKTTFYNPQKTFTIVSWVAEALLKMNERDNVTDNIEKAAEKLGVPIFMATESLRFLARLGFISGTKKFKTYLKSRGKDRKLNVDYIQILEQAQKSYSSNVGHGYFQHSAFLLDKRSTEKAYQILEQAIVEIKKLETNSKKSKVVFIANQIFSVEKEGTQNDQKN